MKIYKVETTRAKGLELISIYECGTLEAAIKLADKLCNELKHTDIKAFLTVQCYRLDETDGIFKQISTLSKHLIN